MTKYGIHKLQVKGQYPGIFVAAVCIHVCVLSSTFRNGESHFLIYQDCSSGHLTLLNISRVLMRADRVCNVEMPFFAWIGFPIFPPTTFLKVRIYKAYHFIAE